MLYLNAYGMFKRKKKLYLTLTSVVFEFHKNKSPFGDLFYLTLTSVVFE